MRRLPLAAALLVLSSLSACSAPRKPATAADGVTGAKPVAPVTGSAVAVAPAAAVPSPFAQPVARAVDPADRVPLSIKRLVSEEQSEIKDVAVLAGPVGDARGRARAQAEVTTLANELRELEASLRAPTPTPSPNSEHLDAIVVKLHRLATRISLLHEALIVATGPTNAVEVEPR